MRYNYHVKTIDGRLLYADDVADQDEAIRKLGLRPEQVKRTLPIKCLDAYKPMTEETKARLRQIHAERRELRKVRGKAQPAPKPPKNRKPVRNSASFKAQQIQLL